MFVNWKVDGLVQKIFKKWIKSHTPVTEHFIDIWQYTFAKMTFVSNWAAWQHDTIQTKNSHVTEENVASCWTIVRDICVDHENKINIKIKVYFDLCKINFVNIELHSW